MLRIKLPDDSILRTTTRTVVDQRDNRGMAMRDHREVGFVLETGKQIAVCSPEAVMALLAMAARIAAGAGADSPEAGDDEPAGPGSTPDA